MKLRISSAVVLTLFGAMTIGSGCGSDDSGGGSSGGGGKDASTGGSGGTSTGGGGSGGTSSGGTSGATGCPAAPSDCNVCEEEEYASCACEATETACFDDVDCANIVDCIYDDSDGGIGPCLDFDATGAACVLACADAFPAGKAKYLAYDACVYCDYCKTACGADAYCAALNGADSGAGGSAGGTSTDAASE